MFNGKQYEIRRKKRLLLKESLMEALERLQKVYIQNDRKYFMGLLSELRANEDMQIRALMLVKCYNPKLGKFIFLKSQYNETLARQWRHYTEFYAAIDNFKAGRKSSKGGLKRFHKELQEERDEKANMLREYKILVDKRNDGKLLHGEKRLLQKNEENIPPDIKRIIRGYGPKTLALKWMSQEYPCTESTLLQIIRYKPRNRSDS